MTMDMCENAPFSKAIPSFTRLASQLVIPVEACVLARWLLVNEMVKPVVHGVVTANPTATRRPCACRTIPGLHRTVE